MKRMETAAKQVEVSAGPARIPKIAIRSVLGPSKEIKAGRGEVHQLRWMLEFIEQFEAREPEQFTAETLALARIRAEIWVFCTMRRARDLIQTVRELSAVEICKLGQTLRQHLVTLQSNDWFKPVQADLAVRRIPRTHTIERLYSGDLGQLFLSFADHLLIETLHQLNRIGRCKRAACGRLFVTGRKKDYCEAKCGNRDRIDRFYERQPKSKRQENRQRSYAREVGKRDPKAAQRYLNRKKRQANAKNK